MSQRNLNADKSFTAGGAIAVNLRVKTSASLALAGSTDVELGTAETPAFALGDVISVHLRTAQGTGKFVADGVITKDNPVYAGASGKVSASGTIRIGVALETTTADGDVLEVLRDGNQSLTAPVITTPTLTLTAASLAAAGSVQGDAGAIVSPSGAFILASAADGTKGIVLPAAADGKVFFIKNVDAANAILKVYPAGTDTINALSASAAISMAAKTAAVFVAKGTAWYTFSLLPS